MSEEQHINRIGNNTHKLIAENLNGEMIMLATGDKSFIKMMYRQYSNAVAEGTMTMRPGDKFYIAKVDEDYVIFGPDFNYEILGRKL